MALRIGLLALLLSAVAIVSGCGDRVSASGQCPNEQSLPTFSGQDGILVSAIDIIAVDAWLQFDASAHVGHGRATMTFRTGALAGYPAFDLRQRVTRMLLDDEILDLSLLDQAVPSAQESDTTVQVIHRVLAPCTEHVLSMEYALNVPSSGAASGPSWPTNSVRWSTNFSDLNGGRYLEMWVPANLIFDTFEIQIQLDIDNASERVGIVTNAPIVVAGRPNSWTLRFPPGSTAMSPLIEVAPYDWIQTVDVDEAHSLVAIIDPASSLVAATSFAETVRHELTTIAAEFGPPPTDARRVFILNPNATTDGPGMEYDNGAVVAGDSASLLRHEALHTWFGRNGFRPANGRDAWIDEGWVTFRTQPGQAGLFPDNVQLPPETLGDEWRRATPLWAYSVGTAIFATLASWYSTDQLDEIMLSLTHPAGHPLTTEELVVALYCALGCEERVLELFVTHFSDLRVDIAAINCSAMH